jgi:hypothetical protein
VFFLGVAILSLFLYRDAKRQSSALAQKTQKLRALLNAEWGMSKAQVEASNRVQLQPSASGNRFYRAAPGTEKRYQTWETPDQAFLGRRGIASYTFFDDKLLAYHIFTSGNDAEDLDEDMRRYLIRVFGKNYSPIEDGTTLKLIWQFSDKTVNYWFYEDEMTLTKKFKAGFGVVYNPAQEKAGFLS